MTSDENASKWRWNVSFVHSWWYAADDVEQSSIESLRTGLLMLPPPPSLSHSHVLSFSCGPILMVRNEPSYRILCAEWMKNFTYIQFVVFCSVSIRYANEWWTTPDKCQLNFFFSMFDVSILISIFHSHSFVFIEAITSIIWLNRWETKMTNGGTFLWL